MTELFISFVCDYCDGLKPDGSEERLHSGWVVWRPRQTPTQEYVFSSSADAQKWRMHQGLLGYGIREVLSITPFRWRKSTGTMKDLEMADRLIEIYATKEKLAPGPNRAFFAEPPAA